MKNLILCISSCFICLSAIAERPWWVEGSITPADLAPLKAKSVVPIESVERLPSVLRLIQQAADQYDVDSDLLRALVAQESNYDPGAVSEDGAVGLGQLMPLIASWCGIENRFHRVDNIHCSARHLKVLLTKYDGNERLALAAYNAGEPTVDRCGCVPNYPETQDYVARVLRMRAKPPKDAQ